MRGKTPYVLGTLLTWISGFVDAVGFLTLVRIYTANMSGNSVALGIQISSQNWFEATRRLLPVVAYVIGLLFSRVVIGIGARNRVRSIASVTLLCEVVFLLPPLFVNISRPHLPLKTELSYIGFFSIAMGIQNGTLTRFGSLTLHTGFVTGTLVKFAEEFTKYLTWFFNSLRGRKRSLAEVLAGSPKQDVFRNTLWLGSMWVAYVAGACCGTLGEYKMNLRSLFVPILGLVVLIIVDTEQPLAIQEEHEQSKVPG